MRFPKFVMMAAGLLWAQCSSWTIAEDEGAEVAPVARPVQARIGRIRAVRAVEVKAELAPDDEAKAHDAGDKPAAEKPKPKRKSKTAVDIDVIVAPLVKELKKKEAPEVEPNQAMVQQFQQQFRPMLTAELAFVRQICDLPKEQRPKVKAAANAVLKEAATKMAAHQQQLQQPGVIRATRNEQPNPRAIIRQGIARVLKEFLNEEQMKLYTEEAGNRLADRKQAAILDFVSRVDTALYLSHQQREVIIESISAQWQDNWEQWLMFYMYGNQYMPTVPDAVIVKHLDAEQKTIWSGLQKIELGFFEGGHGFPVADDGWWGDKPDPDENGADGQLIFGF